MDDAREQDDALTSRWQEDIASASTEEERKRLGREYSHAGLSIYADFLSGLDEINPPLQVDDLHRQWADGARDHLELLPDLYAQAGGPFPNETELLEWLENDDFREAVIGMGEACLALQDIADDNAIEVDLGCPD